LSLSQTDALFSKFRQAGGARDFRRWGDLLTNPQWSKQPISLYGRNAASGTYGYFKEHVLLGGDFKDDVKEQPGSSAVVQGVASDRAGVGYSGIGYKTADVRAVPLRLRAESKPVPAEAQFAYSGEYPLSRSLLLCLNKDPGAPLDPLRREFLRFIFSRQGQRQVIKDGYLPVTGLIAQEMLAQIGDEPAK
jgi:phosphate transport system substrate-binding protein